MSETPAEDLPARLRRPFGSPPPPEGTYRAWSLYVQGWGPLESIRRQLIADGYGDMSLGTVRNWIKRGAEQAQEECALELDPGLEIVRQARKAGEISQALWNEWEQNGQINPDSVAGLGELRAWMDLRAKRLGATAAVVSYVLTSQVG